MVEAMILLCIVPLMALYKYIFHRVRHELRKQANKQWFGNILQDIKTMHYAWLNFATGEMFVCFSVVITIWLCSTFGMFDFLVLTVHDDYVHLPTSAEQYRAMATNISLQLGLALLSYHILVYSVVCATGEKFKH